jgi:hypothetical protein
MPEVYEEEVDGKPDTEFLCLVATIATRQRFVSPFAYFSVSDETDYAWLEGLSLSDGFTLAGEALTDAAAAILRERLTLGDTLAPGLMYGLLVQTVLRLQDALARQSALSATETITLSDVTSLFDALQAIEQVGLSDALFGSVIRGRTLSEQLRLQDTLLRFFGATAESLLTMADVMSTLTRRALAVAEPLTVADSMAPVAVMRVTTVEPVQITATSLLQLLYSQTLSDEIELEALFRTPQGVATWAMNTRTGAVTQYDNFAFNSFARLGLRYLGAADNGLYELVGDDDEGDPIIATLKSGALQMSQTRLHGLRAVYLGVNGEGEFFLRLTGGNGETYLYRVLARDMENTKVWTGKGLRHRYLTYELISTGQDFDLDTIEFVPMRPRRRV